MSAQFDRLIKTLESVLRNSMDSPESSGAADSVANGNDGGSLRSGDPKTATVQAGDAIDRELAAPARQTRVISLRDTDVMTTFRDELSDGLIRADTVNRMLQLVNEIVTKML